MDEMTIDVYQTGAIFSLFNQMRVPDFVVKGLSTHIISLFSARLSRFILFDGLPSANLTSVTQKVVH